MGNPTTPPTIANAGQAALQATGASLAEIGRAAGVSKTSAARWLAGTKVPTPERALVIAEAFPSVRAELWRQATGERARPAPTGLSKPQTASASTSSAADLIEETRRRRVAGGLSSAELVAAVGMDLRHWGDRVDAALENLTDVDRVAGHPGVVAVRARVIAALAPWPTMRDAVGGIFPSAPVDGPAAELAAARVALDALKSSLADVAVEALADAGITLADKFDARRARCARLLRKASLDSSSAHELVSTRTWGQMVAGVGAALRSTPAAISAVQLALEDGPLEAALRAELALVRSITWPSPQFRADPVAFCRTILGFEPWAKQIELLEMVRDNDRVAVASGHRVGKSSVLAALALWFYAAFDRARVFITAPTDRQLQEVDWREIRMQIARAGRCVECRVAAPRGPRPCNHSQVIDGTLRDQARSGLSSTDFRQIVGFTAKDTEAVAGLAGENLLFLVDEASGVADAVYEALEGNRAGGARIVLLGNPTRNAGEHYAAFHAKAAFYKTLRIASTESPNVAAGKVVIPGLATREWVEEKAQEWGEDSPLYKVRVLGEHALGEDGRLIPLALIDEAEARWLETLEEGPLFIGIDPAGPSGIGDESAFALRRGQKIIELITRRGLDDDGHLSELMSMIARHRRGRETTTVIVDAEGVGSALVSRLRQYEGSTPNVIAVFGVKSSANAMRQHQIYDRMRDELAGNFASWLRHGGAIPEDAKLEGELHALELKTKITNRGERSKVTPKDVLLKILKRSPDRFDACALACWEPNDARFSVGEARSVDSREGPMTERGQSLDPYAGSAMWEPQR